MSENLTDVTIIGTPISHYVQSVILVCEEKGVRYQLQTEGHDTPEALARDTHRQYHPFGKIPALLHGGRCLYETSAISRYIDQIGIGDGLVPVEPWVAATMEQWISAINSYYHQPCISRLVSHYVFPRGPQGNPDRKVIEASLAEVESLLMLLEKAYGQSRNDGYTYLTGNRLSLADLLIAPLIWQLGLTPEGKALLRRAPKLAEGVAAVTLRPSFDLVRKMHYRYLPPGHQLPQGN